jgi:hypothetical protein
MMLNETWFRQRGLSRTMKGGDKVELCLEEKGKEKGKKEQMKDAS